MSCTLLSLEIGIIGGLVTLVFSFILNLGSPVHQVVMLCLFAFICMCDLAQPAELPR